MLRLHRRWSRVLKVLGAAVLAALLVLGGGAGVAQAERELDDRAWSMLVDTDGNILCYTGHRLEVGDEFIDADNRLWRVQRVVADAAIAEQTGTVDLTGAVERFREQYLATVLAQQGEPKVGVYHTHSDESYVPSDGTESDEAGNGGVYDVGRVLAQRLDQRGLTVEHSLANHLPHDAGAYERSRRTAMELVRGSAAVFDVHRDAAPPEAYAGRVAGQAVTQVMIVIGRANPQAQANMTFAQAVKAAADREAPGLMRGILRTGGAFNQDLSARALLFEIGAHTNRREEAQEAAKILGSVLPGVIGAGPGAGAGGAGAVRAIGTILLVVLGGGAVWLYIATGGNWRAAWGKLKSLGEEFANYLGRARGRRPRRRG